MLSIKALWVRILVLYRSNYFLLLFQSIYFVLLAANTVGLRSSDPKLLGDRDTRLREVKDPKHTYTVESRRGLITPRFRGCRSQGALPIWQ